MRTKTIKASVGINPGYHNGYYFNDNQPDISKIDTLIGKICKEVELDTGISVSFLVYNGSACYSTNEGYGSEPVFILETTMDPRINTLKYWEPAVMKILENLKTELEQVNVIVTGTYSEVNYISDYHDRDNNLCPDGKIYWAKVREDAIIPTRRLEDAGYDLYPNFEENYMIIKSLESAFVPTGVAISLPVGYKLQIEERGSSGSKGIKYSAGVIDSGYRDEINLVVTNTTDKTLVICKKEWVEDITKVLNFAIPGQYIIYPYEKGLFQGCVVNTCNELDSVEIDYETLCGIESERGTGKLGSSGK